MGQALGSKAQHFAGLVSLRAYKFKGNCACDYRHG